GAGAWWLAGWEAPDPTLPDRPAAHEPATTRKESLRRSARTLPRPAADPRPRLAYAAAMLCGFVGLVYEVAFTRLLAVVIGPTTYAFTTMAASFIGGLALGSAAATAWTRRVARPALWLAAMPIVTAAAASAAAGYAASSLPLIVASQAAAPGATFESVVLRQAIAVGALLLPLTIALGAAFPFALATAASGSVDAAGPDAAHVYAANTVGAIAGALWAGFLLVPQFGVQGTFVITGRLGVI